MSLAFAEVETDVVSEAFVPRPQQAPPTVMHALVVSACDRRRQFLERSARSAGWQVSIFANADAAQVAAARFRHQLAIVDMNQIPLTVSAELRSFAEGLSGDAGPLVMVCGTEGDVLEEIWARRWGAWLYLPGVDSTCDVASLCGEARLAAKKLRLDESREWETDPLYAQTAEGLTV